MAPKSKKRTKSKCKHCNKHSIIHDALWMFIWILAILSVSSKSYGISLNPLIKANSSFGGNVQIKKNEKKLNGRYLELQERNLSVKWANKSAKGFVLSSPIISRDKVMKASTSGTVTDRLFASLDSAEPTCSALSQSTVISRDQAVVRPRGEVSNTFSVLSDERDSSRHSRITFSPSILGNSIHTSQVNNDEKSDGSSSVESKFSL
jgi:hypothetical protein